MARSVGNVADDKHRLSIHPRYILDTSRKDWQRGPYPVVRELDLLTRSQLHEPPDPRHPAARPTSPGAAGHRITDRGAVAMINNMIDRWIRWRYHRWEVRIAEQLERKLYGGDRFDVYEQG